MALTHDDVKRLISIIDSAEHLEEIEVTWGDFQIHLWRGGNASRSASASATTAAEGAAARLPAASETVPSSASAGIRAPAPPPADFALAADEVVIRAPMLGTFYRAASPGDPPFVEAGQVVGAGDTVCLIEVMKLFNSIRAGVDGTVTRILHENATLVEFDEPLLVIRTTSASGR